VETLIDFIQGLSTPETVAGAIIAVVIWLATRWALLRSLLSKAKDIYNDVEVLNADTGWVMAGCEKLALAIQKMKDSTGIVPRIVYAVFGTWSAEQFKDIFDKLAAEDNVKQGATKKPAE